MEEFRVTLELDLQLGFSRKLNAHVSRLLLKGWALPVSFVGFASRPYVLNPPSSCSSTELCEGDLIMKKLLTVLFAISLLTSLTLAAQDAPTSQDSTMKSGASTKATSIMGKISDDGKSFVSDKDGKTYNIDNPDAVKGHEGHHVAIKAHVSSEDSSVHAASLKMAGEKNKMNDMQK